LLRALTAVTHFLLPLAEDYQRFAAEVIVRTRLARQVRRRVDELAVDDSREVQGAEPVARPVAPT